MNLPQPGERLRRPDRRWSVPLASCDLGEAELAAVREVFESGVLTNGPQTVAFERAFADRHEVSHAVAFANGTLALTAIYLASGIGSGDEVIVPSMTFISSATSILHVGATPVFADIDPDTFNVQAEDVHRRVSRRTKAIVAVHYGGQAADLEDLRAVADEAGAVLIEDAAEAHGATYRGRAVGGHGRAGMFSFTPTKNITTGEGGMVTTDDGELASRLRLLRNHGQTAPYRHDILGFNWRMTEMQAAIGQVQLEKLDQILMRKRSNSTWMETRLGGVAGVTPPVTRPDRDHAFMLYTVLVQAERDSVLNALQAEGIESRWYFPPAHHQPVFSDMTPVTLPVTEEIGRRMVSIPFHSRLSPDELERVASSLVSAVGGTR